MALIRATLVFRNLATIFVFNVLFAILINFFHRSLVHSYLSPLWCFSILQTNIFCSLLVDGGFERRQKKPNILVLWFGVFDNACCSCTTYPEFLPPCFLSLLFLPLLQDGCRPCCCSFSVLYILSINNKKSKVKMTLLIMALVALETTQWRLNSHWHALLAKAAKKLQPFKIFFERGREGGDCKGDTAPLISIPQKVWKRGWGGDCMRRILPKSLFQSLKRFKNGVGVGSVWGKYCPGAQ